jgi:hypothetical protein
MLHPIRHGHCPNVATLSEQIHDRPTILPPLKVIETEVCQFSPSQTKSE